MTASSTDWPVSLAFLIAASTRLKSRGMTLTNAAWLAVQLVSRRAATGLSV